ncbi:branched-chain amino acid ABC transporter permease [Candidatus Berkelbacteria bacterium]|nr:branched-chain amino acid ABC transporter permease [Candidatus Berkelbacteria bacterium]
MSRPRFFRWTLMGLLLSGLLLGPLLLRPYGLGLVTEIAIWSLLALSFNVVFGFAGMLSFGQAVFFGAATYGIALTITHWEWSFWPAVCAGVLLPILSAATVGKLIVKLHGHSFVIGTVILSLLLIYVILNGSEFTGGDDGLTFKLPPAYLGSLLLPIGDPYFSYYLSVCTTLLAFLFVWRVTSSPLGRLFLANRDDEIRLEFLGYHPERVRYLAFVVGGAVAGVGGALYALTFRYANVEQCHWITSGEAVVWTLLGGAGTIGGPVVGTAGLIVLKDVLGSRFERFYPIMIGIAIIVLVFRFPGGVMSMIHWRASNERQR